MTPSSGLLLDTNIVSELRKPAQRMNPGVYEWAASIDSSGVYLSAITISELAQWVALTQRRDAIQGVLLNDWLHDQVLAQYAGRILPVNTDVALIAGRLHVPDPRDYRDAFIAASAIHHHLTLVTRNVQDFAPMTKVLNPFT